MKWLTDLFKPDQRSDYQRGYDYVKESWAEDPSQSNAESMYYETENSFARTKFETGMIDALRDLNVPDTRPHPY